MSYLKTASVAVFLAAAMATPVLAQEAIPGPGDRYGLEPDPGQSYYRSYDEFRAPMFAPSNQYYQGGRHFWRDPSRVGGRSPSRNPPS
jgi:hypothetical protein